MGLLDSLKRALTGRDAAGGDVAAQLDQAITLHESGDLAQAEAIYRAVLARRPDQPQALHLLGLAHHQRGDQAAALECVAAAVRAQPGEAQFHFNLGNVLAAQGRPAEAAEAFAAAAQRRPDHLAAWCNLGRACMDQARFAQAADALRRAFALDPALPGLRFELATALIAQGDRDPDAHAVFHEAADLLADHWREAEDPHGARLMLAYSLHQDNRASAAAAQFLAVLEDDPAPAARLKAHSGVANCYNTLGRVEEALHHYREALRLNPGLSDTASSIAALINYQPGVTPQQVLDAHVDWARRFAPRPSPQDQPFANERDPERPLRVGLVSPDLRRHPVTALCAAVLERLGAHGLQVHCYYNYPSGDVITERLRRAAAGWRDVAALDDPALIRAIRADAIDVLIDLAGHTTHNRLEVFARRAAPVQVSWLGYFTTTGLQTMDCFLSDPWSSPPQQDAFFTERLVRLPHTRFCYEPWEWMPAVGPLPALARADGQITFGCCNNLAKLNAAVLSLWARVLEATPGSRLLVQASALGEQDNRERFAGLAARAGIPAARLELRPFAPLQQAAQVYHDIDIALDPFPFCGGMTSFEALWMGVPVVTLEQPLIAGRQTLSMLHNLGHAQWIARSDAEYVAIAASLARDTAQLAAIRQGLRQRFAASPLMDYEGFARDFATALRVLWRAWLQAG